VCPGPQGGAVPGAVRGVRGRGGVLFPDGRAGAGTVGAGVHPRQREVRVLLEGPAWGLGRAVALPPLDGSLFQITYQLWDPGMYR